MSTHNLDGCYFFDSSIDDLPGISFLTSEMTVLVRRFCTRDGYLNGVTPERPPTKILSLSGACSSLKVLRPTGTMFPPRYEDSNLITRSLTAMKSCTVAASEGRLGSELMSDRCGGFLPSERTSFACSSPKSSENEGVGTRGCTSEFDA
jgi:hypothetical protein